MQRKEQRMAEVAQRLKVTFPLGEWIFDANTGCARWNPYPQPNESMTWSGKCIDGMVSGKGVVQWFAYGDKTDRGEGEYKDGYRNGYVIYTYASGKRVEGEWKNDVPVGN
jgi:MORN repeat protein